MSTNSMEEPFYASVQSKSTEILKKVLANAVENGYSPVQAREHERHIVELVLNFAPHFWQHDISEAIRLRLDTILIAGTGEGKTLPYALLLLHDKNSKLVIISPLSDLQDEQVLFFEKFGLPAISLKKWDRNGADKKNSRVQQEVKDGAYRVIITSPEVALDNTGFRDLLSSEDFSSKVKAIVVDEAHCVPRWGAKFRPKFSEIDRLRSLLPLNTPVLAASATISGNIEESIRKQLGMDLNSTYIVNRGNDRCNLTFSVRKMNETEDLPALHFVVNQDLYNDEPIRKTIIFVNTIDLTIKITKHLHKLLPDARSYHKIQSFNSRLDAAEKTLVLERFKSGVVRVLVATEAAGMGLDIRDVRRVVLFQTPDTMETMVQRFGRAARDQSIQGEAILLYEPSAVQIVKKKPVNALGGQWGFLVLQRAVHEAVGYWGECDG